MGVSGVPRASAKRRINNRPPVSVLAGGRLFLLPSKAVLAGFADEHIARAPV